jgi:hypothetical protein
MLFPPPPLENQLLDVDALAGVEILIPNGEMSPNKHHNGVQGQVPSISYTSAQNLGIGDPISHVRQPTTFLLALLC